MSASHSKSKKTSVRLDDESKRFWNACEDQNGVLRKALRVFSEIIRIQSGANEITLVLPSRVSPVTQREAVQTFVFDPTFDGVGLGKPINITVDDIILDCIRGIQRDYQALTYVRRSTIIRNALICYRELIPRIKYGYTIRGSNLTPDVFNLSGKERPDPSTEDAPKVSNPSFKSSSLHDHRVLIMSIS